jgi:hypothetical protein
VPFHRPKKNKQKKSWTKSNASSTLLSTSTSKIILECKCQIKDIDFLRCFFTEVSRSLTMEGYLQKRSEKGIIKQWRRRYVKIIGYQLYNADSPEKIITEPQGIVGKPFVTLVQLFVCRSSQIYKFNSEHHAL